jgi:prevent-host-death family protein
MGRSLPITEARDQLMKLADEMVHTNDPEAIIITKRGRPVMTVLLYEAYESLIETLAILRACFVGEAAAR